MPRLSPTDCLAPAFGRVKLMLFQPFRLSTWLKMGFVGWLAGGVITLRSNVGVPARMPHGRVPGDPMEGMNRVIRAIHAHNIVPVLITVGILVAALVLIHLYLFCRFRFILFDSVVSAQAVIQRGWHKYSPQANRYFVFWFFYRLVTLTAFALVIGVPVWRAYKSGVFQGENPMGALIALVLTVGFATFSLAIVFSIVSTLLTDFILPLMALDDLSLESAWAAIRDLVAAEPGSWAGYMGLKLLLALATAVALSISAVFLILAAVVVLVIPVGLLVGVGVMLAKSAGGAGLAIGAVLIALAIILTVATFIALIMLVIAPVSVFFSAYALYFFGGRYPKLGALLWPSAPSGLSPQSLPTSAAVVR